jgi:hypothetical protein
MKKTTILLILSCSYLFSSSLSSIEITNMISKIKEERIGISIEKLETTVNPFILKIPKKEENLTTEEVADVVQKIIVEPTYLLEAILNNTAFINKKWYRRGHKIGIYTIGHISQKSVTLKSLDGNKVLSLKKKKSIKLH